MTHKFAWNPEPFTFTVRGEETRYAGAVQCEVCGLRLPLRDASEADDYVEYMNSLPDDGDECGMIVVDKVMFS